MGFPEARSARAWFSIVDPFVPNAGKVVRIAGAHHEAVEVRRVALGHQHALAAARRAAREVGVRGRHCRILRQDLVGEHGDAPTAW